MGASEHDFGGRHRANKMHGPVEAQFREAKNSRDWQKDDALRKKARHCEGSIIGRISTMIREEANNWSGPARTVATSSIDDNAAADDDDDDDDDDVVDDDDAAAADDDDDDDGRIRNHRSLGLNGHLLLEATAHTAGQTYGQKHCCRQSSNGSRGAAWKEAGLQRNGSPKEGPQY